MSREHRYTDADEAFEIWVPESWEAEQDDEEGGVLLYPSDGEGLLHLIAVPQVAGEMPDPAEELYSFLEDQGIDLQEDEVEDLELSGDAELSLCEYMSEDEEDPEAGVTYWIVAVATAPGSLVFASYSSPASEGEDRETVRRVLASLELRTSS